MERIDLVRLTREECNDILLSKGFTRTSTLKDEI